jgi:hypothetical protein
VTFDVTDSLADGSIDGLIEYSSDLFERSSTQHLAARISVVAEAICGAPTEAWLHVKKVTPEQSLPDAGLGITVGPIIAPRSALEVAARDAFALTLGVAAENISVEVSFFALGGNSLKAVLLSRRLSDALGHAIGVAEVLQYPTVAMLASAKSRDATALPPLIASVATDDLSEATRCPVSMQQEQMLIYQLANPESTAYNMPQAIPLPEGTTPDLVRAALARLVCRQAALRTLYALKDGAFSQVVLTAEGFEIPLVETHKEFHGVFDLLAAPPVRAQLRDASSSQPILMINIHHVITDHQSVPVVARELRAFLMDEPLAPLALQYADYALWQTQCRSEERIKAHYAWWRHYLVAAPQLLEVPLDTSRPTVQRNDTARATAAGLGSELAGRLRSLCRAEATTLNVGLLATWGAYLARLSGASTVIVAQPHSLRHDPRLSWLIGYFHTVIPIVYTANGTCGTRQAVRSMHESFKAAFQHTIISFHEIVAAVSAARSSSYNPLAQTDLVYHEPESVAEELAAFGEGSMTEPSSAEDMGAEEALSFKVSFDFALYIWDGDGALQGVLAYDGALITQDTARAMMARFERFVSSGTHAPEVPLSELPIMWDDEMDCVLRRFNVTATGPSNELCVHEMLAAQTALKQHAIALEFENERFSYLELWRAANAVAVWLEAHGVRPNIMCALQLRRTAVLSTAIFGVLIAGGAYLPLDPTWPVERRRFIVHDARCLNLLTHHDCLKTPAFQASQCCTFHVCMRLCQ